MGMSEIWLIMACTVFWKGGYDPTCCHLCEYGKSKSTYWQVNMQWRTGSYFTYDHLWDCSHVGSRKKGMAVGQLNTTRSYWGGGSVGQSLIWTQTAPTGYLFSIRLTTVGKFSIIPRQRSWSFPKKGHRGVTKAIEIWEAFDNNG